MRRIRGSASYAAALRDLLAFGETCFGSRVVDQKRARISHVISNVLAFNPAIGSFDQTLGVYTYPIARTPFILLYDFDDDELRLTLIIHARSDRTQIDLTAVEWDDE